MSILIVCDVCGKPIGPDEEQKAEALFSMDFLKSLPFERELEDLCTTCVSSVSRNMLTCLQSLSGYKTPVTSKENGNRGSQKPKGITRITGGRADHSNSHGMRLLLCQLVDEGKHTRSDICEILYSQFPNYRSADSLGPRVSDLSNPKKAHLITRFLGPQYKNKVAMTDPIDKHIKWKLSTRNPEA